MKWHTQFLATVAPLALVLGVTSCQRTSPEQTAEPEGQDERSTAEALEETRAKIQEVRYEANREAQARLDTIDKRLREIRDSLKDKTGEAQANAQTAVDKLEAKAAKVRRELERLEKGAEQVADDFIKEADEELNQLNQSLKE